MSQLVEVKLWGTTLGYLGYQPGQTEVATFEYTAEFAQSGIQISPLQMVAPTLIHSFPNISQRTFKGLPGIMADSLPDAFGNQLIDLFMAQKNITPSSITALDRLLYIGSRGMGALEYHPAESVGESKNKGLALDVHTLAELAACVVSRAAIKRKQLLNADNRAQALRLIRIGSSAGGARSKALVARSPDGLFKDGTENYGISHRYYLLKFDSENNQDRDGCDPKGMTRVEYLYSKLARECQIDVPNTDSIVDGDDFHYLIERFDLINNNGNLEKLHYASWCGINHVHREVTGVYGYEQLIMTAKMLGLGQSTLTEIFKRAIFNVVGRNQDDHTKNFGFLMNKAGKWSLAPAFDLTYAFDPQGKWTKGHQITLSGKQTGFVREDLLKFAEYCNLNARKASRIIERTTAVFKQFEPQARALGVSDELLQTVRDNLRLNLN